MARRDADGRDRGGVADAGDRHLSIGLIPLPHFTLLAFAGFVDTLRLSADEGDRSRPRACRWTILSDDARPIRASCGAEVAAWERLRDPARFDHLVVVGGLLHPGRRQLNAPTAAFLREAQAAGVGLIGICTGSLALVEAGVIGAGRPVCVSWFHHQDLLDRHPHVRPVSDRLWLRDGRVITCAGGTAAIDLAASLLGARLGEGAVRKSLDIMVTDTARPASAAQPQPPNLPPVANSRVRRAVLLIEQSLGAPPSTTALAQQVAISKRQLERLFQAELGAGVQRFARDLRLSRAVWRMARSRARLTDIAMQCGFADPAHFNRLFRAAFGIAPSVARRRGPAALLAMLDAWWPYAAAGAALTDTTGGEEQRPYRDLRPAALPPGHARHGVATP